MLSFNSYSCGIRSLLLVISIVNGKFFQDKFGFLFMFDSNCNVLLPCTKTKILYCSYKEIYQLILEVVVSDYLNLSGNILLGLTSGIQSHCFVAHWYKNCGTIYQFWKIKGRAEKKGREILLGFEYSIMQVWISISIILEFQSQFL